MAKARHGPLVCQCLSLVLNSASVVIVVKKEFAGFFCHNISEYLTWPKKSKKIKLIFSLVSLPPGPCWGEQPLLLVFFRSDQRVQLANHHLGFFFFFFFWSQGVNGRLLCSKAELVAPTSLGYLPKNESSQNTHHLDTFTCCCYNSWLEIELYLSSSTFCFKMPHNT